MGHVPLLDELAIVAILGVIVSVLLAKLKLPTVAGLLAAGALMGPFGLRFATSVKEIEILAEVGVVFLLFTIGLEFSLSRLKDIFQQVALGGLVQVGLTAAVTVAIAMAFGQPIGRAVFFGFVFALSSTAIVLRALVERRELEAPHGRFIVGTLIFQDLCVVPMVLIVPLLGSTESAGAAAMGVGIAMGKAVLMVVAVVVVSRFVVPKVLGWVDASRSREVFLLAILGLCIGTAWLTSLAGLSLALGAFLGGMVVADTEYGHRAMGDILPLRDAFMSVFFVSLGMLFDVRVVFAHPGLVLGLLLGFLVAKGVLATLAAMVMRFPARAAWLAGVGLAQFGEFGFVLTRLAQAHGVVDADTTAPLLAAGIVSMFITPLLVRAAPHITAGERLLAPLERLIGVRAIDTADEVTNALKNHVVLVGFGLAGNFAARALRDAGSSFVVIDLNADNVRGGKAEGLPVYYGDATSEEALRHAHIEDARLVVLLINDPNAVPRILDTVKRVAPAVPVLMRTHFLLEKEALLKQGARDVVAEEVEGAVEVIARMLRWVETPRSEIEARLRDVRRETQTTALQNALPRRRLGEVRDLDEMKIESVRVHPTSAALGESPVSLQLQTETGALVFGVRRGDVLLEKVDAASRFEAGDIVYFVGTLDAVARALPFFQERTLGDEAALLESPALASVSVASVNLRE